MNTINFKKINKALLLLTIVITLGIILYACGFNTSEFSIVSILLLLLPVAPFLTLMGINHFSSTTQIQKTITILTVVGLGSAYLYISELLFGTDGQSAFVVFTLPLLQFIVIAVTFAIIGIINLIRKIN